MTRPHSDALEDVLAGSFSRRLIVDVFHGSERVMQDLGATAWSFDGDLFADVKHSGTLTIVYQSEKGESLVPEGTDGVLSPYRAKLLLLMEIMAGGFSETITLGYVRVDRIVEAFDRTATVNGAEVVVSSTVRLSFVSLESDVQRGGFYSPEQPPSLTSAFSELRRILPMPVVESVTDAPIPVAVVYEASTGGRLKAAQQHSATLGGIGVVDPTGAWAIVRDTPVGQAVELRLGENGTVVDIPYAIDTETAYTTVVGTFETVDRKPLFSKAQFAFGELLSRDLYPDHVAYVTSDRVTTQAQADAFTQAELKKSLTQRFEVPVQCVLNPLVELGDLATVVGHSRPVDGRVVKYSLSDSALMTITLEATREF